MATDVDVGATWAPEVLLDLDLNLRRILGNVETRPRTQIIEDILEECDDETIQVARNSLFDDAAARLDSLNTGMSCQSYLILKKRKGHKARTGDVEDVYDLYLLCC